MRQLSVLMIDAQHTDQRLLKEALESVDPACAGVGVTNTDEALAYLRDGGLADLIVFTLDPDLTGIESIRALKNDGEPRSIPVAVFSGGSGTDEADAVFARGASLYLDKPFNFDQHLRLASELIDYIDSRPPDGC